MGTWTVEERPESRRWMIDSPPGEASVDCVYHANWKPANAGDPYPGDDSLLNTIAGVRTRPPSALHDSDPFLKTLVARTVEAVPVRALVHTWLVTVRYSTRGTYRDGAGEFVAVTRSSQVRNADMFRKGASLPADGTVTWGAGSSDIGATKVDLNGNPRQYEVPQQLISLEYYHDRTLPSGTPNAEPAWSTYSALVGVRNDATFLGCPKGTLLYRGFQSAPVDNYYRLSHTFLYDAWFHLQQVPAPNPTGVPILTPGTSMAGQTILQVDKVLWYQRYDSFGNFSSFATAQQLQELTSPVPVAIP